MLLALLVCLVLPLALELLVASHTLDDLLLWLFLFFLFLLRNLSKLVPFGNICLLDLRLVSSPSTSSLCSRRIAQCLLPVLLRLCVRLVTRISLPDECNKHPHSLIKLSNPLLPLSHILPLHHPSNPPIRSLRKPVLISPSKSLDRREPSPSGIERLDHIIVPIVLVPESRVRPHIDILPRPSNILLLGQLLKSLPYEPEEPRRRIREFHIAVELAHQARQIVRSRHAHILVRLHILAAGRAISS